MFCRQELQEQIHRLQNTAFVNMGIEYRVLDRSYHAQYVDLVHHVIVDEPLSRSVGMQYPHDTEKMCRLFEPCLDSGLTIGALDTDTGALVGCRSTVIKRKSGEEKPKFDMNNPDEYKIALIFKFDDVVHENVDVFAETGHDVVVHFFGLFVEKAYRRRGIARRLVEMVIDLARDKGYRAITAEASSNYSRQIFDAVGFRKLKEMRFDSFQPDGEVVFRGTHPHEVSSVHCLNI